MMPDFASDLQLAMELVNKPHRYFHKYLKNIPMFITYIGMYIKVTEALVSAEGGASLIICSTFEVHLKGQPLLKIMSKAV